jgi:hypothetical protein
MRPEVSRAVRAAGGGPWLLSFDTALRSLEAVGRLRQPRGDLSGRQIKPGSGRFPFVGLFFGGAFAVQP